MSLGHISFTGHLAKDPRFGNHNGRGVVNFTVGTSRRKKDQQDNWIDVDQTFIDCAVWQRFEGDTLPQRIAALQKGHPVSIAGQVFMKVSESQGQTYRNVACHVDTFAEWWKPARDQQQSGGWNQQASAPQSSGFDGGDEPPF